MVAIEPATMTRECGSKSLNRRTIFVAPAVGDHERVFWETNAEIVEKRSRVLDSKSENKKLVQENGNGTEQKSHW